MRIDLHTRIWNGLTAWLNRERPRQDEPPCDFERLSYEIRPCDVILVEGRSRIANVIKYITLSPWTHAALYIGRLHDIDDPELRDQVRAHYDGADSEQLILEALLGQGTIIAPLTNYRHDHVRICRPRDIARRDAQAVIRFCTTRLGAEYDVRQLLDLARFMFPYGMLPRRWRSSLFTHNAGAPTRTVCSSLLAQAFSSVHFPVLPLLRTDAQGQIELHRRNFKLFTPSDFDYSPYFDVIKYPLMEFDDLAVYRRMPWTPVADSDPEGTDIEPVPSNVDRSMPDVSDEPDKGETLDLTDESDAEEDRSDSAGRHEQGRSG